MMGYAVSYPKPEKAKKDPYIKKIEAAKKFLHKTALAVDKIAKRMPIKKVSKKMSARISEYSKLKAEFIKDKVCPIYPHLKVTDIHHKKGRTGDLLLDTNYWLAVSRKGHMKIELNPNWAKYRGFSLERN